MVCAQGSFPSENGLFTINYLKGCAGTEVVVTPVDPVVGTYFFCFEANLNDIGSEQNLNCFNEKGEESPPERYTYQYDTPGTYNILLLRQLSDEQQFDSLTIEILSPNIPKLAAVNCNNQIAFNLNTAEESYDEYTIDFGDGSLPQTNGIDDFPITYSYADNSLRYDISVTGNIDNTGFNNCNNNQANFSIIPGELTEETPSITGLSLISEESVEIDFNINAYQHYYLQVKTGETGPYTNTTFISGSTADSFLLSGLSLNNTFYCFRLVAESLCDGSSFISNEACTILLEAEATNDGNFINWNSSFFQSSRLFRNGQLINEGTAPFLDFAVLCGQEDTYTVEATDANGLIYRSLPQTITAIAGVPFLPIEHISTNIINNQELLISWTTPEGLNPEGFNIYRRGSKDERYVFVDSANTNSLTISNLDFARQQFFFNVTYTNSCGGESPYAIDAPNILLQGNQTNQLINLRWSAFTGYGNELIAYTITQFDDNMGVIRSVEADLNTSLSVDISDEDLQRFIYQVTATSADGKTSTSNIFILKKPPFFTVPSAFSPNGDGLNEELKVLGKFIEEVELLVYDRWGNLLFKTTTLEKGWNGYLAGREAPQGTYTYSLSVTDKYGERYSKSGTVNLIR